MKIFKYAYDGGKDSTVTGFWIVEIKSFFSIVLLKFAKGSRENYHSHAFNAFTWFLHGEVREEHVDGTVKHWKPSFKPKWTPKTCFHKVHAEKDTWALSIRGKWDKTWFEYNKNQNMLLTLENGRNVVKTEVL